MPFDFDKQKFVGEGAPEGDAKKFLQEVFARIAKKTGGTNLFEPLEKFLKQRQYKLNEITELLTVPGFEIFKDSIWFAPNQKKSDKSEKQPLALTDIFTVYSQEPGIEPWLLSNGARYALGIERNEKESKEKPLTEILKQFKVNAQWAKDWDATLGALYGVNFSAVGKTGAPLSTKFEPKIFSVVSYGTIGKTTYKLFHCRTIKRNA